MSIIPATAELLDNLARRPGHDEVKAGFRQLLNSEFGVALDSQAFEVRAPVIGGRLDSLVGRTVFEAKRNLKTEWDDVRRRMPDYLADRQREYQGARFVGLASDGAEWVSLELDSAGALVEIARFALKSDNHARFLAWLDGTLALKAELAPDALTIRAELGEDSLAWRTVRRGLETLWAALASHPTEALKRQLWADLLKQVYGREVESDALWFQHTYLVVVAKCIALAVMDLHEDDPARLLSGEAFTAAGIHGAVESDFFDWVIALPEGVALVRKLIAHVRRFRLREVESDVLKVLYESLIDRDQRHGLGEYYTPDWLAAKVVREAVDSPAEQRVLDPACGSGTFLFHAIRHAVAELEAGGVKPADVASEAARLVAGMDIHPVAVIIARVTYMLALAPALRNRAGSLSIPVFLGDSLQLSVSQTLTDTQLRIAVPPPPAGSTEADGHSLCNGKPRELLIFPETFCRDSELFDKALERMRTASLEGMARPQVEAALVRITEQHYKADLTDEQAAAIRDLGSTFALMDRLRREQRDTIWAYVARNLSRPLAYASGNGWATVLLGNPPWVAFRHMSDELQKRFKELAKAEKVYVARVPSHNDLCALFTVRASHLYLRPSGRIAFVLPLAALTRGQFERFRAGSFESYNIAWDAAWTMDERVQPLFPVPACVVFGRKRAVAQAMPLIVRAYAGNLPMRDAPEAIANARLQVTEGPMLLAEAQRGGGSSYRTLFRQGAILVPRMLALVNRRTAGRLGINPSEPHVESSRSSQEKRPWRDVQAIDGPVEREFLRPALLGESILPYRKWRVAEAVTPIASDGTMLSAEVAAGRGIARLAAWMRKAEAVWDRHGTGARTFVEQLNYINQLSGQFPVQPLRVVFAASGTLPAASVIRDERAIVEHKLYWAAPETEAEANYLAAILNSETARALAERYQSRGQFGARDFDKVIFNLPIPRFSAAMPLHYALANSAAEAETLAAAVPLPEGVKFQRARRLVRDALKEAGIAQRIDAMVAELLAAG
jgi:hypothetical protein